MPGRAFGAHLAAVHLHQLFYDSETKSRPARRACPRLVGAVEAIEDVRKVVRRDARPAILDTHLKECGMWNSEFGMTEIGAIFLIRAIPNSEFHIPCSTFCVRGTSLIYLVPERIPY